MPLLSTPLKVALRVKLAARPVLPTLWYENEAGERWLMPVDNLDARPPEGFIYQWSRFPSVLRETCLRVEDGQSREIATGESSWPTDLVLAMVRPSPEEMHVAIERHGEEPRLLGMDDAIILSATSCGRCLNALSWRYGLDDGYSPFGPEWAESNTRCAICETPGVWEWLLNEKNMTTATERTRADLKSNEHYTEFCRECSTVMGQCRCSSPNKATVYGICDACAGISPEERARLMNDETDKILAVFQSKTAVIREENGKYCVRSPNNPDWNGGCYNTKGEAEERLKEVEFFKRQASMPERVTARYLEAAPPPHQRGWEHRKEKDERALINIPPEHQLLWKKIKNQFKGTPHERAEQFMEYVEEHPGENDAWLQENADKEVAKFQREQQKQVKLERDCEKNQTKYEEAWYKEQERQTKEKQNLKQLKDKADGVCQACPTCKEEEEMIPFAASVTARVASRFEIDGLIKQICGGERAIVALVTSYPGMDVRIYTTDPLQPENVAKLDAHIRGIFHEAGIEDFGDCKDKGGAILTYMTQSAWKHIKDALEKASWDGVPFKLLLAPQPSSYPDAKRHHIVIDARGDTIEAIKKVLLAIKNLGDIGHSTSVDIDGKSITGVDGDGSDRIKSIVVDDMPLEKMSARVAARYKSKKHIKTEEGKDAVVYTYSEGQIARRNAEKAKRLEGLRKNIGNLRTKVKRDLRSSDPEKALTALAIALMDHTAERVGNPTSAEEREHYGVTGWQKSHVSFGKGKATVKYTGKSGVEQSKTVSDKAILSALRNAYEACGDDDGCLFDHSEAGKITAEKVNAYLEPFNVSAKDIRGYHANARMMEALKAARSKGGQLPEDKKERAAKLKEEFKTALEATAEEVGHEAATLRSQYLIPGLESEFLKSGEVMSKMKAASYEDYTYARL